MKDRSALFVWEKYREHLAQKGKGLKIANDIEYANHIENMLCDKKFSPKAVLYDIIENNIIFKTKVCFKTLYNYIDNNIFFRLTNKDLPVKRNKKRIYKKVKKRSKIFGYSIEKRPKEADKRNTFGRWEMDCIIGAREKEEALLVLTERLTRYEIIRILPEKKLNT
ncbi:MAG: IS30 family transposase [Lachnospirales bacterium]